jgi:predicted transcriptional regulator
MVTEEIRQNFHRLIDTIANDQSLAELYEAAELYLHQQTVLPDTTDPVLLARMKTSLEQAERGELITNEEVQKQVQQWLGKQD